MASELTKANFRAKYWAMRIAEIEGIFESPQIVGPTDFELSNPVRNRVLADKILKKASETIDDRPNYVIVRAGDERNGNIALIDKAMRRIDYIVHYHRANYAFLSTTVTQLMLWRRRASPWVQGLTRRIFFDYLLKRYPAILSDGQQTERGREFWENRMAEATTLGLRVGLANLNTKQVIWYDPSGGAFTGWMSDHSEWGSEGSYQALRYVITH